MVVQVSEKDPDVIRAFHQDIGTFGIMDDFIGNICKSIALFLKDFDFTVSYFFLEKLQEVLLFLPVVTEMFLFKINELHKDIFWVRGRVFINFSQQVPKRYRIFYSGLHKNKAIP